MSQSRRQLPAGRGGGRGCSWDGRAGCAANNGTRRGHLSLVAGPGWPTSAGEGGQGPGRAHGSWASGAGGPLHQATGSLRVGASCPPSASAPPPPSLPGAPTSSLGSDPEEPVAVGLREAKSSSSTGDAGLGGGPPPPGPRGGPAHHLSKQAQQAPGHIRRPQPSLPAGPGPHSSASWRAAASPGSWWRRSGSQCGPRPPSWGRRCGRGRRQGRGWRPGRAGAG